MGERERCAVEVEEWDDTSYMYQFSAHIFAQILTMYVVSETE